MELQIPNTGNGTHKATRQELSQIIAFLDAKLPVTLTVHFQVLTQLRSENPAYSAYFMRRSDGQYSAIMAVNEDVREYANQRLQRFWLISAWSVDQESLLKLYNSINVFDWQKDEFLIYDSNLYDPYPIIGTFLREREMKRMMMPVTRFTMDRKTALNLEMELPDDIYIKSLEPNDAQIVWDHWPHKYCSSFQVSLENIIDLPSAGLFLKDGDRLVAWAVCFPPIGISRFHTLDEFRSRGYGAYVIKYLSKKMAQEGYCPYGGIFGGNEPSVRCFTRVGYTVTSSAEPISLVSDTASLTYILNNI